VPSIKNISITYLTENKKVRQQKNKHSWIGSLSWVNSPYAGLYHPFVYEKILSSITLVEFSFLKFLRFFLLELNLSGENWKTYFFLFALHPSLDS
jgi:hypothetical protein